MSHIIDRVNGYRLRLKAKGLQPRHLYLTQAEALRLVGSLGLSRRRMETTMSEIRMGRFVMRGMYVHIGRFTAVVGIRR